MFKGTKLSSKFFNKRRKGFFHSFNFLSRKQLKFLPPFSSKFLISNRSFSSYSLVWDHFVFNSNSLQKFQDFPSDLNDAFVSFCYCCILPFYIKQKKDSIKNLQQDLSQQTKSNSLQSSLHKENDDYFLLNQIYTSHFLHLLELYNFPKNNDLAVLFSLMYNNQIDIKNALLQFSGLQPPTKKKQRSLNVPVWQKYQVLPETQILSLQILEEIDYFENEIINNENQPINISKLFANFLDKRSLYSNATHLYVQNISFLDNFNLSNLTKFLKKVNAPITQFSFNFSPHHLPLYNLNLSLQTKDMWLSLDNISFTKLRLFERCSFQYFFRYILHLRPKERLNLAPTMTGIALHRALASVVNKKKESPKITLEELTLEAKKEYTSEMDGTTILESMKQVLVTRDSKRIEQYIQREVSSKNIAVAEEKFAIKLADDLPLFIGTFDRIEYDAQGNVIIKEYKTHLAQANQELQLYLYSLAYERIHKIRPSKLILESIANGKSIEYIPTENDIQAAESFIRSSVSKIKEGFFQTSSSRKNCASCDFKHLCPAAAQSKHSFDIVH